MEVSVGCDVCKLALISKSHQFTGFLDGLLLSTFYSQSVQ